MKKSALPFLLLFPAIVFAQPSDFAGLVTMIVDIINLAIPFLFSLVFIFLVWKVFVCIGSQNPMLQNGPWLQMHVDRHLRHLGFARPFHN